MKPARGRRPEPVPVVAFVLVAAWALLLLFAPPAHNAFWAVNGLRSVASPQALALVLAAALAAAAVARPPGARWAAPLVAVALALLLGFPLRERLHLLGDTGGRNGAVAVFADREAVRSVSRWAETLHAQPLDLVTGLFAPGWITRATGSLRLGISGMVALLMLAFCAGAWRLARRLASDPADAWGLWLVLLAWGGLEAYAGYAESAALVLAAGVWWWWMLLRPLRRRRDAILLALAWLGLWASHRLAFALLVPHNLRLSLAQEGDEPGVRRDGLIALAVAALVAVALQEMSTAGLLGRDVADLFRLPARDALVSLPSDLANLALFLAPSLLLALAFGGWTAMKSLATAEGSRPLLAAAIVLLPAAVLAPVAGNGLGVQRDWDLGILLGLTATVAGARALAQLPAARRRVALLVGVPLLVLQVGGFVAVNANLPAAAERARALVGRPPALGRQQASGVLMVLGDRALGQGHAVEAAQMLITSWQLVPSPARGLHAVRACVLAGDLPSARRLLADLRGRAPLPPREQADARGLDSLIARGEQDSAAAARRP